MTYAVVARLDEGTFGGHSLRQTYQRIAEALNLALKMMGVERALISADGAAQNPRAGAGQCFVSVSRYEISEHSRKVIGSAQKRFRDRFLQHGSVLLDFDGALQAGCVQRPDPDIESKIAPLNRILGRKPGFDEISRVFASAFEASFRSELELSALSDEESGKASELESVYAGEAWTQRGCR